MPKQKLPYNKPLEDALSLIFEKKYYGEASSFQNSKHFKRAITAWIKKVQLRLDDITNNDERLKETTSISLELLAREIKRYPKGNNETIIIAYLIQLVNYLLGYDWNGLINRNVFYFQGAYHEYVDLKMKGKLKQQDHSLLFNIETYQKNIIQKLTDEGLTEYQISRILNLSPSKIKGLKKYKN